MHPVARQALLAALDDGWADPTKLYAASRRARQLLDAARASLAESLGIRPDELYLTASGSAAAEVAVAGGRAGRARVGRRVVHSTIEHSAVLKAIGTTGGPDADPIAVDRAGRIDVAAFTAAVAHPGTALACLISASHEVGTRQPVEAIATACQAAGVPLYVDAAQSVPWGPVAGGWSLLTASAAKWGGPAGVGVLAVRKGTRFDLPAFPPPGLNLPALVAAAAALRAVHADAAGQAARLSPLVERIRATVAATVPDVEVVGDPVDRLPHLVTFSCLYVDGEALLHALDRRGFAVSSGSSCTSDTIRPSHVLEAMGVLSHGNVRISLHRETTGAQVDRFLAELPGIVADLREQAGAVGL
jgi:cysteine desulfurase